MLIASMESPVLCLHNFSKVVSWLLWCTQVEWVLSKLEVLLSSLCYRSDKKIYFCDLVMALICDDNLFLGSSSTYILPCMYRSSVIACWVTNECMIYWRIQILCVRARGCVCVCVCVCVHSLSQFTRWCFFVPVQLQSTMRRQTQQMTCTSSMSPGSYHVGCGGLICMQ
jgi:hypothetical protein